MKHRVILLSLFFQSLSVFATDSMPVDYHHYLNVLGASEGAIIVQSNAVDHLNVKLRKNVYRIQSVSKKLNQWVEKKTKTGSLRYRLSTMSKNNHYMIEYKRTETLPDGRVLNFSGNTYITDMGR